MRTEMKRPFETLKKIQVQKIKKCVDLHFWLKWNARDQIYSPT